MERRAAVQPAAAAAAAVAAGADRSDGQAGGKMTLMMGIITGGWVVEHLRGHHQPNDHVLGLQHVWSVVAAASTTAGKYEHQNGER